MADIMVLKANGQREPFRWNKVKNALSRVGISGRTAGEVIARLQSSLYDGITTKKIYRMLYQIIDEMKPEVSHRFNLKNALFELGPEGHYFEDFIAKLMEKEGYNAISRQMIQGKFLNHEIDVVAQKTGKRYMVECKFHNLEGTKCSIQTALYVYSRFLELVEGYKIGKCEKFDKPWLVTNTKFSEDVITYIEGMGIPATGWRYPIKDSLEVKIDKTKCYPVSALEMDRESLSLLLRNSIVSVFDLPETEEKLRYLTGVKPKSASNIIERLHQIR
ncbi:MAG: restriction endonuclease [Candidatus Bilamarchaeum sp.]